MPVHRLPAPLRTRWTAFAHDVRLHLAPWVKVKLLVRLPRARCGDAASDLEVPPIVDALSVVERGRPAIAGDPYHRAAFPSVRAASHPGRLCRHARQPRRVAPDPHVTLQLVAVNQRGVAGRGNIGDTKFGSWVPRSRSSVTPTSALWSCTYTTHRA